MKSQNVVKSLKQIANNVLSAKRANCTTTIDDIFQTMESIGGITGIHARQGNTITLVNHTDSYNLPIKMPEYGKKDAYAKTVFPFFEELACTAHQRGMDKSAIQFHLGRDYASKHHPPEWYKKL